MTKQQCKDQIARKYGHTDFEIAIIMQPSIAVAMTNELNTLYAIEKVKEALEAAAERLPSKDTGRADSYYSDTDFDSEAVVFGYNMAIDHSHSNILALKTELVNNIKNDK